MESTKWKKQQDEGDRVAEVVQEEYGNADPDLGNVLEEDNAVDPGAENGDAPAAEEDADAPLLGGEEGEDVPQFQLKRNKNFCQHPFKFSRNVIQESFWN